MEQMKDVLPSILLSVVMGMVVWCISVTGLPLLPVFIMQVLFGAVIYIARLRYIQTRGIFVFKKASQFVRKEVATCGKFI